jgi:transposase-like protein
MVGRRWTAEQARTVLDGWEESGQSCAAYARAIGVVPQRLSWWRRRLVDGGTRTVVKSTLVPVTVRGAAAIVGSAPVVVTTRAGARIEVNEIDAATAAWVVGVLVGEERS